MSKTVIDEIPDISVPIDLVSACETFGGIRHGDTLLGQPIVQHDRLVGLTKPLQTRSAEIVIPKLVEVHCHLDKCHSVHRMGAVGGDLLQAIETQHRDKANWSDDDLRTRARHGIQDCCNAGCDLIRSHIDWGSQAVPPRAWEVLTELDTPAVQWAALTSVVQMADPDFARSVAQQVARTNGVLGCFLLHHPRPVVETALRNIFAEGARHGLMLDFHVDEGLGSFHGVEMIADLALQVAYPHPILCGHAVALMDKSISDMARIAEKLARANITICSLPTTNLYLQGRMDGTPDRRGLTRLRELRAANVTVTVGSDNVADAFCPVGQHDPMAALHLSVMAAHLDPPLAQWLPMITTDARAALGHAPTYVDGAALDDLLVSGARTTAELVAGRANMMPARDRLKGADA